MNEEQLRKEVFLLEHGFYDEIVDKWYMEEDGIYEMLQSKFGKDFARTTSFDSIKKEWFRHKHPEEFNKVIE